MAVGAALVLVLVGAGATAVRGFDRAEPARETAGTPTPSASPSRPPDPLDPDDLEGRLIVPAGFAPVPDAKSGLGDLDVDGLLRLSGDGKRPEARGELLALGFERGRGHAYLRPDGVGVLVVVSRYTRLEGANTVVGGFATNTNGVFLTRFPNVVTRELSAEGLTTVSGRFAQARFLYELFVVQRGTSGDRASFDRLLPRQFDLALSADP